MLDRGGQPPCPLCVRSDTVWKLTEFFGFSRDLSHAEYSSPVGILDSPCVRPAASLEQCLKPPARPGRLYAVGCFTIFFTALFTSVPLSIGVGFCASILLTNLGFIKETDALAVLTFCFFASLAGVAAWLRRAERKHKQDLPRWQQAWARWQEVYYCCRCDQVFVPGSGTRLPLEEVQRFLYE